MNYNIFIPVIGAIFVVVGISIRMGYLKQIYWKTRRSMYGYIPLGLVFILVGYYPFFASLERYRYYSYIALLAITVVITVYASSKPPEFMKPAWVKWIEKHPKNVQKAMKSDADADDDWKERVGSEANVDAWAKELARKLPKKK